jgi:hypothetical protein
MDVDAANNALRQGGFQKKIQPLIEGLHPEAAYFTTESGRRTAYIFFDLADPSQIPQIAEPLFEELRAEIEFKPVMNRADLAKGLQTWSGQKKAA